MGQRRPKSPLRDVANTTVGQLTKVILRRIEADIGVALLLAHWVDCPRLHVAEVAVLFIHEAWPGGGRGFAESVGIVIREVIHHQNIAPLLLETKFGRSDRTSCSRVLAGSCWLRIFQRHAMVVRFLFFVDNACGIMALNYTKRLVRLCKKRIETNSGDTREADAAAL